MNKKALHLDEFESDLSEISEIAEEYQDFYSRLSDRLGGDTLSSALAPWITKNTTLNSKPFSFREHEFQIDIANDTAEEAVVKKCSQVGLSELSVRITLALLAVSNGRSAIYVLPSAKFGAEFSKARINPVIENSAALSRLIVPGSNGAMMKRLGDSLLYIGGAANASQAISRPADALIVDEYDFCNMAVMTMYHSRLRHSRNKFRRKFSTPTVSNYGISKEYDLSDMKAYFVRCEHCGQNQKVDWNSQVVIPGFTNGGKERSFLEFDKEDLLNPDYDIAASFLMCERCSRSLDASLATPSLREWVAAMPSRKMSGYHVRPFDLITYNSVPEIITQIKDYDRSQDYWNFVHGEHYASNENQINEAIFKQNIKIQVLTPDEAALSTLQGYYMGVDVGKTCHVMVGRPVAPHFVEVVYACKVRSTDGPLLDQIKKIYRAYNCYRGVIDAGPDFTLGQGLRGELGEFFQQAMYVRGGDSHPRYHDYDPEKDAEGLGVMRIYRTKAFDALVQEHNKGRWLWPLMQETETEILEHMRGMKRIEIPTDEGEKKPKWVKVSDFDHYMHAAMYLKAAIDQDEALTSSVAVASPTIICGAALGGVMPGVQGKHHAGLVGVQAPNALANLVRVFGIK